MIILRRVKNSQLTFEKALVNGREIIFTKVK